MDVCETSILDWESGKQPYDRMYPTIISFLGYEPWAEPKTLTEALQAERRRRGLSAKTTAKMLRVDEATYARWERNNLVSCHRYKARIAGFLSVEGFKCIDNELL